MQPARTRRRHIGMSVTRLEDRPLVTGTGTFVADLNFLHQLHVRIVRSSHAFGRVVSIDLSATRAYPGVVAAWVASDLGDLKPIPYRATSVEGLQPYRQPALAKDFVRYVGEPVAMVIAPTLISPKTQPISRLLISSLARPISTQRGSRRHFRSRPVVRTDRDPQRLRRCRRRFQGGAYNCRAGSRRRSPFGHSDRNAGRAGALRCRPWGS